GLLTAMMRRQLDDMHERGEPLAALYASEAPIYGRFGYGLATYQAAVEIERSHAAFARAVPSSGRLSMVDVPTAVSAFSRVWEQARRKQPGMLGLDERWMRVELADLELYREGASPHYRVLYQADESPSGFAVYRLKLDWDASVRAGRIPIQLEPINGKAGWALIGLMPDPTMRAGALPARVGVGPVGLRPPRTVLRQ